MRRKTSILILTYAAACIMVLGGFLHSSARALETYRSAELHARQAAVSQLSDSLARMSDTLTKGKYVTSPALLAAVSGEVWDHASAAVAALSVLPLSDVCLERTGTFIARTGDYARYLARCAANQRSPSGEERDALARLAATAEQLSRDILTLEGDLYAETLDFKTPPEGGLSAAAQRFSDLEDAFPDWEGVDYDGDMSAHVSARTPLYTAALPEVNEDTAWETAARALGLDAAQVQPAGETEGAIPAYTFASDSGASVTVTKNGGLVLDLRGIPGDADGSADPNAALHSARRILEELGYTHMRRIWQRSDGETLTLRFAAESGGVLIYPDAVTVGISLSDGSLVRLNAADYVMNHHDRKLPDPKISADEAVRSFSEDLQVQYTGPALIHTPGYREVLCLEFLCTTEDGRRMLIWCDGETGEQTALQLLDDETNGMALN